MHMLETKTLDYYEFLQISPHADSETIHRVYRFLAARFHPDNPVSGDPEKFFLLKAAYDVLSDPDRRAAYDVEHAQHAHEPEQTPLSNSVDFMDQVQGEMNRRLAVLAVLYYRRRANPYSPEVGLAEIEKRMGFPRDYLDFTTWYLAKKGYITRADNSDFALTADGVDFVETQRISMPVLNKLLTNGNAPCMVDVEDDPAHSEAHTLIEPHTAPLVMLPDSTEIFDRRRGRKERRVGAPDMRSNKVERRVNQRERRAAEQHPAAGASLSAASLSGETLPVASA
jgi:hypothetical protein